MRDVLDLRMLVSALGGRCGCGAESGPGLDEGQVGSGLRGCGEWTRSVGRTGGGWGVAGGDV